jgi:DedD protein
MEKKKLLLVAISVGIFLALTIGAALLVFVPKDVSAASMAAGRPIEAVDTGINAPSPASSAASGSAAKQDSSPQPSSLDPVELVRQPKEVPGLQHAPEGANRQGGEFRIVGSGGESGKSTETLISVPKPSTAAVPDAAPAGKAAPAAVQAAPKPAAPAAVQTAPKPAVPAAAQAAPKPASPAATAAQTQAKPAPTTQAKVHNDYWVQTGAFSSIAKAEGVKATLSSKGITSIIENREVEGRTVFRVRVGPYTSQNEAAYWLSLIKSINGFEDSQVRQTQSRR